jgi:hypothetical protein
MEKCCSDPYESSHRHTFDSSFESDYVGDRLGISYVMHVSTAILGTCKESEVEISHLALNGKQHG